MEEYVWDIFVFVYVYVRRQGLELVTFWRILHHSHFREILGSFYHYKQH